MAKRRRAGRGPAGVGVVLLLGLALGAGGCTRGGEEAIVIGDPSVLRPDDRELTPSSLLLSSAGYLDRPAKVRTEIVRVRGTIGDCLIVNTRLGPQDLDLCVDDAAWGPVIRPLKVGTPIVAIGTITAVGPEESPRMVLQIAGRPKSATAP